MTNVIAEYIQACLDQRDREDLAALAEITRLESEGWRVVHYAFGFSGNEDRTRYTDLRTGEDLGFADDNPVAAASWYHEDHIRDTATEGGMPDDALVPYGLRDALQDLTSDCEGEIRRALNRPLKVPAWASLNGPWIEEEGKEGFPLLRNEEIRGRYEGELDPLAWGDDTLLR